MLHLVCEAHASKRHVAALAIAFDWKAGMAELYPPVCTTYCTDN